MITSCHPACDISFRFRCSALVLVPVAVAMLLCLMARPATAQTCIYNTTPPGQGIPSRDWRGIASGQLPQEYHYYLDDDLLTIRVDDGSSMNVASDEVVVVLVSKVDWAKEIKAWNPLTGTMTKIATNGAGQQVSMRLTRTACSSSPSTIVLSKPKAFGIWYDMYHVDPVNFWRLYGGKILTIKWYDDRGTWAPTACGGCVPVGTPARVPATKLVGDFDGDGASDIALIGPPGWTNLPVAFSQRNGAFKITNSAIGDFAAWAATPNVKFLTGDFDGDGRTDIALTGGSTWGSVPVALSRGDGTFLVTNFPLPDFAWWAATPGVKVVTGDFNGDHRTDIALTGAAGWASVPVAFALGDGSFRTTNKAPTAYGSPSTPSWFPAWAATPGVKVLSGDFNGDGRTDLALTGAANWASVPVAFSKGDGGFGEINATFALFASYTAKPQAQTFAGDFNGDGLTDIAVTGGGLAAIPIAYSAGINGFAFGAPSYVGSFPYQVGVHGARVSVGDFNGDGRPDLALTGGAPGTCSGWASCTGPVVGTWNTVPIAFTNGGGGYTNSPVGDFGKWAGMQWATTLVGDFNGDGKADLALTGASGWNSLPVAFSNGDGSFIVTNQYVGDFAKWASAEWGTP